MSDIGVATNLSADAGAEMSAKFANIMQMDQSNFDRFASTIVALGNNFTRNGIGHRTNGYAAGGSGQTGKNVRGERTFFLGSVNVSGNRSGSGRQQFLQINARNPERS